MPLFSSKVINLGLENLSLSINDMKAKEVKQSISATMLIKEEIIFFLVIKYFKYF